MSMLFLALAGLVLVVIAVVLIYAATLPSEFRIARAVRISATRDKIFPLIDNLSTFNQWNPFVTQDPTTALSYDGPECGKGARFSWTSQGRGGKGSLEIFDSEPSSSVTMLLHMLAPMEGRNKIIFTLQPSSTTTTDVTWSMTGRHPYIARVFGVLFNMEKIIGRTFDKGLADLKTLAEQA